MADRKTYQCLLKEIAQKRSACSEEMQPPCKSKKLLKLQARSIQELSVVLPSEYAEFLEITDGIDWNGLLIYASENSLLIGYQDRFISGFIEENLSNRKKDFQCEDLLFFGESGVDAYVYKISTREYQILDRTSLDLTEAFYSFEFLMYEAIKAHL